MRFETNSGLPAVDVQLPISAFKQDFGTATVTTTWNVPADAQNIVRITVKVDPDDEFLEDRENNNERTRRIRTRPAVADTTPPVVTKVRISDDEPFSPFNQDDPIVTKRDVKIEIVASDSAPGTVKDFCVVSYTYDVVNRRWVEEPCIFAALPAPQSGTTDTFVVDSKLQSKQGVAYAFVWVRDAAGNISRSSRALMWSA